MNKENTKTVILIINLGAITLGVSNIPENTSVIDLIKGLYIIIIMLFVYVVMKDI